MDRNKWENKGFKFQELKCKDCYFNIIKDFECTLCTEIKTLIFKQLDYTRELELIREGVI